MKKIVKILLLATIALSLLVACNGNSKETEKSSGGKTIKIGISKDPVNLNPVLISDAMGESFASNIFDTLVSYKDDVTTPAPALAEKWTISKDGKEYTFNLRKGVKFQNGDAFTAKDVKFTLEAFMDEKNASPSKQFFNDVDKVEAVDDYTVKITLKKTYAPFLLALGSPQIGIMPSDYVKKIGMDKFDRSPVGTGPFKFSEWTPDDHITLVRNNEYWGGKPNIETAIFRPIPKSEVMSVELKSGGVDIATNLLPEDIKSFSTDKNYVVNKVNGLSLQYMGFSAIKKPYSDVRFRKAVYYATDFENAIKGIYGDSAERAYSYIPPSVLGNDKDYMKTKALPYDEVKAKALFDELKKDGVIKDGMEIEIFSPQDNFRSKVATAIASSLTKFGFKVKVQTLEFATLLSETKEGKGGMYFLGWSSVPDPDRWTYSIFSSKDGNRSAYKNDIVDSGLEEGRGTIDTSKREEAYKKAMRQALTEDYIHIPLVFKNITVISKPTVKNFEASPQEYIYLFTPKRNVDIVN